MDGVDLARLYTEKWPAMMRLAVLLVDDRASAEDIVQDAFVALHRRPPRSADSAAAYLRICVVNNARSALRRRGTVRRHLASLPTRVVEQAPAADRSILVADQHAEVLAAVRALPPRQREVLVLRYWSELSEAEIAEALGISTGTVKSSASRGLDALERSLGGLR